MCAAREEERNCLEQSHVGGDGEVMLYQLELGIPLARYSNEETLVHLQT